MGENIAKIVVNPKTKRVVKMTFYNRDFRFRCKRCATFCCKLGGPNLFEKDIQRLNKAGYAMDNILEATAKKEGNSALKMDHRLGKRDDGSCVFLRFNDKLKIYECSVYDVRPVLCRIYPFDFERVGSNSFALKFIPCCMGLDNPDGEIVDEKFISNYLLDAIFEIL